MNLALSVCGRPSNSQMTASGSLRIDEIGRASIDEQVAGEPVGDCQDARLHLEDGAAAKGFVDDAPQPCMVGLVHGEHVVGKRADDARHPPAKPCNAAAFLAQGEGLIVFQDAAGQLVIRRDPDLADDGKLDLDDRPNSFQPLDANGWVAEVVLIGEVQAQRHGSRLSL
jgi:hypothetical protein